MRLSFILRLAFRDIKGYKLRSSLTIGGVAIGIGFIIFLLSLGFGLEKLITSEVTDVGALQIFDVSPGKSKIVKLNDETIEKFKELGTLEEIAPSASMAGKIDFKTSTTDGVIYGKNFDYLTLEDTRILAGGKYSSENAKEALLNITALKQLGIKDYKKAVGEKVKLTLAIPSEFLKNGDDKSKETSEEYTIVGVIDNESSPYVYVPLTSLIKMDLVNYNKIKTRVKDKTKIDIAKVQLENLGFKVISIKDTVSEVVKFFTIFKFILVGFGMIAMIVASMGMFNTLTISLLGKTREIGLMKALGTSNKDINLIFLTQALNMGIIGGLAGTLAGYSSGTILNFLIYRMAIRTGNEPVELFYTPPIIILSVLLFSIAISFLTGIYPSRRAARISALNALRYE
ncbi:hypothetical protein COY62_01255 [bacterium (Candidatus Howlettbacteria) CG_4_10_14_0_8_um_filter_40_9]|nr:MAG: hypothetical protein COY62_01255 [bacterium (Candidatus Howlettbacteria) CG_4_10_14_0_8_um_filter_40_9]